MLIELTTRELLPPSNRLPHGIVELETTLLPRLYLVDHGYNPSEVGRTAAATLISGHLYTAAHNLREGQAIIISPGRERQVFDFISYDPDTAVSLQALSDVNGGLRIGATHSGDFLLAFWLRHIGRGVFLPCHMWGENVGHVRQGNNTFWGFRREGIVPRPGDSGAVVMTIGRNGEETTPEAIGILRGSLDKDTICVFSPLLTS